MFSVFCAAATFYCHGPPQAAFADTPIDHPGCVQEPELVFVQHVVIALFACSTSRVVHQFPLRRGPPVPTENDVDRLLFLELKDTGILV